MAQFPVVDVTGQAATAHKRPRGPSSTSLLDFRPGKIHAVDDDREDGCVNGSTVNNSSDSNQYIQSASQAICNGTTQHQHPRSSNDTTTAGSYSLNLHPLSGSTTTDQEEIRCSICRVRFQNTHLLDLHILERHDSMEEARRSRGDLTFRCLEQMCEKVCLTWQKRRLHCIDKHRYPRDFDFFIINDGIDGRISLLQTDWVRRRRTRHLQGRSTSISGVDEKAPVEKDLQTNQQPDQKDVDKTLSNSQMETDDVRNRSTRAGRVDSQSPLMRQKHETIPYPTPRFLPGGGDGATSSLPLSRQQPQQNQQQQQQQQQNPSPIDSLVTDFSAALRFVPPSVQRSRRKTCAS